MSELVEQRASESRTPIFRCLTLYAVSGWAMAASRSSPSTTHCINVSNTSVTHSENINSTYKDPAIPLSTTVLSYTVKTSIAHKDPALPLSTTVLPQTVTIFTTQFKFSPSTAYSSNVTITSVTHCDDIKNTI